MRLRCIIGHDYGDIQTTETRDERENERVVTVKEYKECRRCGHRTVVSENTEVRPIEKPSPEDEPTATEQPSSTPESSGGDEISQGSLDAEPSFDEEPPVEDDGVILDDDSDEPARAHGEWPPEDDQEEEHSEEETPEDWPDDHVEHDDIEEEPESGPWPEHDAEDEGFDAEPSSSEPVEDVDFGGGLTPQRTDDSTGDSTDIVDAEDRDEYVEGSTADRDASSASDSPASGIERSGSSPSPSDQQRSLSPDATFECPQCGFTSPAIGSSLRPGDICPECQRGYLTEAN